MLMTLARMNKNLKGLKVLLLLVIPHFFKAILKGCGFFLIES